MFAERACLSRRCSTRSKAERRWKNFSGFPTVTREMAIAALEQAQQLLSAKS